MQVVGGLNLLDCESEHKLRSIPVTATTHTQCVVACVHGAQTSGLYHCGAVTVEHLGYNPKDSELCLANTKPQETGVEVLSRLDVQISGIS